MVERISRDQYFLDMAVLASKRATCSRRSVGCILVDAHNHVLSSGYNGVVSGAAHCLDRPCPGAGMASGTGLSQCQAVHAEMNALLQCKDCYSIATCYTTASPCILCTRMLLNTSCQRVVFLEEYPHPEAKELWNSIRGGFMTVNRHPSDMVHRTQRTWWQWTKEFDQSGVR